MYSAPHSESRRFRMSSLAGCAAIACWTAALSLFLISPTSAQLTIVSGNETLVTEQPAIIHAPDGADLYLWSVPPGVTVVEESDGLLSFRAVAGRHTISCQTITADWDAHVLKTKTEVGVFVVGTPEQDEDGDGVPDSLDKCPGTPAGTEVDDDGCPIVTPTDAPFPAPGLTVVIVIEASETGSLPQSQSDIFTSSKVIRWCNQNCAKINGTPLYRVWDDDLSAEQMKYIPDVLKDAYGILLKDANGKLPWIGISDGKTGYSGPLPLTIDETMTLLQKYGG